MLLGLVGVFSSQWLLLAGLQGAGVSSAVVLGQLVPVYACVIAVLRCQVAPSKSKFSSIFVCIVGAMVMSGIQHTGASNGNLFFLVRSLCFATYLSLQGSVLSHLSPATVACISQLTGGALLFVASVPFLFQADAIHAVPAAAIPFICGMTILTSVGYLLTLTAGRSVSPVVAAVYGNTQPITACLLNAALLAERLSRPELYGGLIILIGAFATVTIEDAEKQAPGGGAQLKAMECYLGSCGIVNEEQEYNSRYCATSPQSSIRVWLCRVTWKVVLWTIWWALLSSVVALSM